MSKGEDNVCPHEVWNICVGGWGGRKTNRQHITNLVYLTVMSVIEKKQGRNLQVPTVCVWLEGKGFRLN